MGHHRLKKQILKYIKTNDISYSQLQQVMKDVRKESGLTAPKSGRHLPVLLTAQELENFFNAAQKRQPKWELAFRLLLATTLRINKFSQIEINLINYEKCRIFIRDAKGGYDKYVPFPTELSLAIRQQAEGQDRYLFEASTAGKAYSVRYFQKIMAQIATDAGITKKVYPHLFRHQTITFLLESGMSPQKVMLISGHETLSSLEIYKHLALNIAHGEYQKIMSGNG